MTVNTDTESDHILKQIKGALKDYELRHPQAQVDLYRQNQVSVRIRVIDPDFASHCRSERHEIIWTYLQHLPEDVSGDISMIVLITPDERMTSFANLEFEDPLPSRF